MSNKKKLKKSVNNICSELFAECVAVSTYSIKPDRTDISSLLTSILVIHSNFISRISHPEPGMKQKKFFKQLIKDFNQQVGEIVDQINNLN